MDEKSSSFNQGDLSPEDLEILRAFEAMDSWEGTIPDSDYRASTEDNSTLASFGDSQDEMLDVFVTEADQDIVGLHHALQELEQIDITRLAASPSLLSLKRGAHKIKGTGGAVGCTNLSTIALYIEITVSLITDAEVIPQTGLDLLKRAIPALDVTLKGFVTFGQESDEPLKQLEAIYNTFGVEIQALATLKKTTAQESKTGQQGLPLAEGLQIPGLSSAPHIDIHRFEQLVTYTGQMAELRGPMEAAQLKVEQALQELYAAYAHLRRVEVVYSLHFPTLASTQSFHREHFSSTLLARIRDEKSQRIGHIPRSRHRIRQRTQQMLSWEEMDFEHFTEEDVQANSLSEAIADVATASSQLRLAINQVNTIANQYVAQAANIRNTTLQLRSTPIGPLFEALRQALLNSGITQHYQVECEIKGENIEIDQDVLNRLQQPLLQLLHHCIAACIFAEHNQPDKEQVRHTWFYAWASSSEVSIELGFPMEIQDGALDIILEPVRHFHGTVSVQPGNPEGVIFLLRIPRLQGVTRALLARVGKQKVIIPFSQIQRIDYKKQFPQLKATLVGEPEEQGQKTPIRLSINELLALPAEETQPEHTTRVVLSLASPFDQYKVEVDEVIDQIELGVKPLPVHLQRPGLIGATIDSNAQVLLVLDLPELIRRWQSSGQDVDITAKHVAYSGQSPTSLKQAPPLILIADDSVYIRQSLRHLLQHAGYRVTEAHDGLVALERLLDEPPTILLLDMEMPNLNGYDLLAIIRAHPELAQVKIIMLTSRSADEHQQRAFALGAHAYLIKPCPPEVLLATVQRFLAN